MKIYKIITLDIALYTIMTTISILTCALGVIAILLVSWWGMFVILGTVVMQVFAVIMLTYWRIN